MAGTLSCLAGVSKADFVPDFVAAVNEARRNGASCPEVIWAGTIRVPPRDFAAGAVPLARNALLDGAANTYARRLGEGEAQPFEEAEFADKTGYLYWRLGSGIQETSLREPTGSYLARSQISDRNSCRSLMAPDLTEIGVGSYRSGRTTLIVFVAGRPFKADATDTYRTELLGQINELRESGVTCFGTAMPPKPPLTPSPDLTRAAEAHSDEMAAWPFPGPPETRHVGPDGDGPADRLAATRCEATDFAENVAINATDPSRSALIWTGQAGRDGDAGLETCRAIMGDASHIGIGVAHAPALAATGFGRGPWITVKTARLSGACQRRAEAAGTQEPAEVMFDPEVSYRISNVASDGLSLDVLPHGRDLTPDRFEAVILAKTGSATGQKWHFVRAGSQEELNPDTYLLSSAVRDAGMKLTSTTSRNPFALTEMADQAGQAFGRFAQYWYFTAVPGQADTYTVGNTGRRGLMLAATGDGRLTFSESGVEDPRTHWHITPFRR